MRRESQETGEAVGHGIEVDFNFNSENMDIETREREKKRERERREERRRATLEGKSALDNLQFQKFFRGAFSGRFWDRGEESLRPRLRESAFPAAPAGRARRPSSAGRCEGCAMGLAPAAALPRLGASPHCPPAGSASGR